jgi:hypothetical protein
LSRADFVRRFVTVRNRVGYRLRGGRTINRDGVQRVIIGICFVSLVLAQAGAGRDAAADRACERPKEEDAAAMISASALTGLDVGLPADAAWTCLPRYGEPDEFLHLYPHAGPEKVSGSESVTTLWGVDSADFDGDGWPDAVLWRGLFQTGETFELDVLLNDGQGNLALGTSEIFSRAVPSVVEGRELVLADFNGDGRSDMFFADQGMDTERKLERRQSGSADRRWTVSG